MIKTCSQGAILLSALLLASCGSKGTNGKVYPVMGAVKYTDGSPVVGGSISFQPMNNSTRSVTGTIKEDGTFSLNTLTQNAKLTGAAEGDYRVIVMPPLSPDHTIVVMPVTLEQPLKVEPKENQFRIEIVPVQPRS